jgi:hypothetical protein
MPQSWQHYTRVRRESVSLSFGIFFRLQKVRLSSLDMCGTTHLIGSSISIELVNLCRKVDSIPICLGLCFFNIWFVLHLKI